MNIRAGAGGACFKHGIYEGFGCPSCQTAKAPLTDRLEEAAERIDGNLHEGGNHGCLHEGA